MPEGAKGGVEEVGVGAEVDEDGAKPVTMPSALYSSAVVAGLVEVDVVISEAYRIIPELREP